MASANRDARHRRWLAWSIALALHLVFASTTLLLVDDSHLQRPMPERRHVDEITLVDASEISPTREQESSKARRPPAEINDPPQSASMPSKRAGSRVPLAKAMPPHSRPKASKPQADKTAGVSGVSPIDETGAPALPNLFSLQAARNHRQDAKDAATDNAATDNAELAIVDLAPKLGFSPIAVEQPATAKPHGAATLPHAAQDVGIEDEPTYTLQARNDGSFGYSDPERRFRAVISPDGELIFKDGTKFKMARFCLLGVCSYKFRTHGISARALTLNASELAKEGILIESAERYELRSRHRLRPKVVPMVGRSAMGYWSRPQIERAKSKFAKATETMRLELNLIARRELMVEALDRVDRELELLWRDPDRPHVLQIVRDQRDELERAWQDHAPQRGDNAHLVEYRLWMRDQLRLYRFKLKRFICGHAAPSEADGFRGDDLVLCR